MSECSLIQPAKLQQCNGRKLQSAKHRDKEVGMKGEEEGGWHIVIFNSRS